MRNVCLKVLKNYDLKDHLICRIHCFQVGKEIWNLITKSALLLICSIRRFISLLRIPLNIKQCVMCFLITSKWYLNNMFMDKDAPITQVFPWWTLQTSVTFGTLSIVKTYLFLISIGCFLQSTLKRLEVVPVI